MGTKVKAVCTCGLDTEILIGGGMYSFQHTEYFPCLCSDCKKVVQVNLKEHMNDFGKLEKPYSVEKLKNFKPEFIPLNKRKFTCSICEGQNVIPYNDTSLMYVEGEVVVAQSFDNVLKNGLYKCPVCNNMTLKFLPLLYRWD